MADWAAKRFWDQASVDQSASGYRVLLDGRRVRTPAKSVLEVPTRALAQAIADEWQAQKETIDPAAMPFTRSANAAIDKVAVQFTEVAALISDYGDSDLICYRATDPDGLVKRQAAAWDPLINWAQETFDAPLIAVAGVIHIAQPDQSLKNLRAQVQGFDAFGLTALHDLVSLSGSLVIGLAAAREAFDLDELWVRSRVDEEWQIEQWGHDEEASALTESRKNAFFHASKFLRARTAVSVKSDP